MSAQQQSPGTSERPDEPEREVMEIQKSTWCRLLPIIREEAAYNLKRHKYSGCDEGIAYKLFYNPIATKLVTCLPDWVAPNLLTLIGFIHTIVPLGVLIGLSGTGLFGEVPNWFFFFQAWCYFAYRMLDEMDGK